MDDRAVIKRLQAFEAPDQDASCRRGKHAVGTRISTRTATSRRSRLTGFGRLRLTPAFTALCIGLTAGTLFTPAGHAVSSWIGERLGFGEPGGPPTLRDLRSFATKGSAAEGQPAYVLLRGPAPGVGHYELITYRSKNEPGKLWPANGARCFELNFPEARAVYGATCGLPSARSDLRLEGSGGGTTPSGGSYFYVSGRVSDDVDTVDVKLDGKPASVELAAVPAELIERFGIRRSFKFFIAFLDNGGQGGLLTVTARDGTGQEVAQRRRRLPNLPLMKALPSRRTGIETGE